MWNVTGTTLKMAEGDYGIELPVTVNGATFANNDVLRFTFRKTRNGEEILHKEYSNITKNTANLMFTEAETALFPVGTYYYGLDWYQDGAFMCNIILDGQLKVADKV